MRHSSRLWDPCISHKDTEQETAIVKGFISNYFNDPQRMTFFIAGAGFDPRATNVAKIFVDAGININATLLIKEERPNPLGNLMRRATENTDELRQLIPHLEITSVNILSATDNAVVGGRYAVSAVASKDFSAITDIVVDISALSIGVSFPIIRYLHEKICKNSDINLHIFVSHQPNIDSIIVSYPCEKPNYVHGFSSDIGTDSTRNATILWLPQLASHRVVALRSIHTFLQTSVDKRLAIDTCPIIPFPSHDIKLSDKLIESFLSDFESGWSVDARDIVYASEDDPLDLYRTILDLDDLRRPVFEEVGGSILVLSPIGNKLMALGSLLAALERNLSVAYLESMGYNTRLEMPFSFEREEAPLMFHLWLAGSVYPKEK